MLARAVEDDSMKAACQMQVRDGTVVEMVVIGVVVEIVARRMA